MKTTLALLLLAGASSLGNFHASAATEVIDSHPTQWELEQRYFQTSPESDTWWRDFHDPVLTALIERAVENNYNVAAAARRIEAAAQVQRQARAGYYPTLSANASWTRDQTAGTTHSLHAHPTIMTYFTLGVSMNWELDVFGRIRSRLKADKANLEATRAEYDGVLVSVAANVAKAYFQLRLAQAEIEIAERNISSDEELERLACARYEVGLRPWLDVLQARMTVTQARASLPTLRANARAAINELAILVGEYPGKLEGLDQPSPLPAAPPPVVEIAPAQLLKRRPDIVEAEQQLAAAAAQVGIAKKDFLPVLSVSAEIGTESQRFNKLFGGGSLYYNVMPTLSWTLFDGMSRCAGVARARALMEAQIDEYNLTVTTALQETDNAMVSWRAAGEKLVYQEMLLKDARRQLELQVDRYKQGLNAYSDVQAAQVQVLQYENAVSEAHAAQLDALVTLYAALGGGFSASDK